MSYPQIGGIFTSPHIWALRMTFCVFTLYQCSLCHNFILSISRHHCIIHIGWRVRVAGANVVIRVLTENILWQAWHIWVFEYSEYRPMFVIHFSSVNTFLHWRLYNIDYTWYPSQFHCHTLLCGVLQLFHLHCNILLLQISQNKWDWRFYQM